MKLSKKVKQESGWQLWSAGPGCKRKFDVLPVVQLKLVMGFRLVMGKAWRGWCYLTGLSAALIKATIAHFKHQAICYNSYNCLSDTKI